MGRYDRHTILKEIGPEGQQKLLDASVLLVGVGGLGSPIALYLAAAGVGHIGLVDSDTVSESNLQRQVLYSEHEIGLLKVECARRRLLQLSSQICMDTYPVRFEPDNASAIAEPYDLIIDGCDNFPTRYLINDLCVRTGKPYVYGSIGEFHGQVSVFNYQGSVNYRDLFPDEQLLTSRKPEVTGVMGVVPGIVGTLEAAEAIKIITGCGKVLSNRLLMIDVLTMQTEILDFQ